MIYHQKKISNILEKSIANIFKMYGFRVSVNHCNGIDIVLLGLDKSIEVKSSFRYCKNNNIPKRKKNYRFSHYSIKENELNGYIDNTFYLFIEKVNKKDNFVFLKALEIRIIKAKDLKKLLSLKGFEFDKRIQISVQTIKKLKFMDLFQFIDYLEN